MSSLQGKRVLFFAPKFFNYEIAIKCNTANMMNTLNQKQERQQLVKEIADEVISRISIMFDTDNAISKIKALNEAINKLEQ